MTRQCARGKIVADLPASSDLDKAKHPSQAYLHELVQDGMVHVPEAAKFLGIGKSLLYRMMELGEVPFVKFHGRRCIPRRALVELAASRLVVRQG